MEQHLLSNGPLLDEKGNLAEAGYAFGLVKEYDRKKIKGLKSRIKEWDYYFIHDDEYGIALTIDDNSYMGLVSVSVLDFDKEREWTKSYMKWLTFGETGFPSTSKDGDVFTESKKYSMFFQNKNGKRRLVCHMKNVAKGRDFTCDITLSESLDKSMVIATPFKKKKHFYYNQKINLLMQFLQLPAVCSILHAKMQFILLILMHVWQSTHLTCLHWAISLTTRI